MRTRQILSAAIAVTSFVMLPALASAQVPNSATCLRRPSESYIAWENRCRREEQRRIDEENQIKEDTDRRVRMTQQQTAETARQRAILEKQPPLPASRNRLLGRWESSTRPPSGGDPFAQLAAMLTGCGVLLGDGIVEFEPTRWAIHDSDGRNDMGAIEYRGGTNGAVFGLPAKGSIFQLLPFEFENPDTIHLVGVVCTLKRTNTTVPASRTGAPVSSSRAASARPATGVVAPGAGASPTAPRPPAPARSSLLMIRDKTGYQCPDKTQLAVESCFDESDQADCQVVRVDLPPRNGFEVTFIEKRGVLIKRVSTCAQRGLVLRNGVLAFTP